MTHGGVFTQILVELGVQEKLIATILEHIKEIKPGTKIDQELSDSEAASLLASLRDEKEGIRGWLLRCRFLVTPPEGSA